MPRFVMLRHETPPEYRRPPHWDLMLEFGESLRTWALFDSPESLAQQPAEALGDHRLAYLDYEGPVSGNRGVVRRFDAGAFTLIRDDGRQLVVSLRGTRLRGQATLTRVEGNAQRWLFSFVAD